MVASNEESLDDQQPRDQNQDYSPLRKTRLVARVTCYNEDKLEVYEFCVLKLHGA